MPVFVIILLGYGLGHTRLFSEQDARVLIGFVWYIAIPALLFRSLASRSLPSTDELLIVVAYYVSLYLVYMAALLIARLYGQSPEERPVFAFVVCFGNGGFLGIPLLGAAFGDEGVRMLLIILSFHTLTLLPVSTMLLERARNSDASLKKLLIKTFRDVRENPIIISLFIGLSWSALNLPFPIWLDRITELPAAAASPVGLFAAGLSLTGVRLGGDLKHALTMVSMKLLLLPVLVFVVSRFGFGLPDLWVGTATITAALPSGMVSYSFATKHDVGARRAASAVLISTGLSVLTLSVLLIMLDVGQVSSAS